MSLAPGDTIVGGLTVCFTRYRKLTLETVDFVMVGEMEL